MKREIHAGSIAVAPMMEQGRRFQKIVTLVNKLQTDIFSCRTGLSATLCIQFAHIAGRMRYFIFAHCRAAIERFSSMCCASVAMII